MTHTYLKTARIFAKLMDGQFSFFGIKFGIDAILGLVPGLGDVLSMLLSAYLVWVGIKMNLPTMKIIKMIRNIIVDAVIGSIPVLGDIGDVFLRVNLKNLQILEDFADRQLYGKVIEGEIVRD